MANFCFESSKGHEADQDEESSNDGLDAEVVSVHPDSEATVGALLDGGITSRTETLTLGILDDPIGA